MTSTPTSIAKRNFSNTWFSLSGRRTTSRRAHSRKRKFFERFPCLGPYAVGEGKSAPLKKALVFFGRDAIDLRATAPIVRVGEDMKILSNISGFLADGFSALACAGLLMPYAEMTPRRPEHYYLETAERLKDGYEKAKAEATSSEPSGGKTRAV